MAPGAGLPRARLPQEQHGASAARAARPVVSGASPVGKGLGRSVDGEVMWVDVG